MASLNLSGVALVTGASKGIGRAICLAFAVSGVRGLVLSGRNQGDLQAAATDAQALATNPEFAFLVVPGDVGVEADIINLMSKSVEHFGRIDYAVNNAGFIAQKFRAFADVPTEELDALTNVNQRGTFLCTREEIKAMKKQDLQDAKGITATAPKVERGSIVNISSAAALSLLAYSGSYTPTTWARNGMTKCAALDHAVDGIRVNCVRPATR
ncbi:hypothetical protein DL95DRAFT_499368 [Leptodontidium sp. 2 PMI_412]|nr:hypothetical protein DL95DRAFT_499368 [Leptodontidium sp. 2 PMI_412]